MLAQYMEFSKRKVSKHLEPSGFAELDQSTLEKYAEVFDITVEELRKTE
jgi:hypothetical protein